MVSWAASLLNPVELTATIISSKNHELIYLPDH